MTHAEKVELLIRVDERTNSIETWCKQHARHHFAILLAFVSTAVTVIIAQAGIIAALLELKNSVQ